MSLKTIVLSGASSGIGEACALRLVEQGFRVCAGVRRLADAEGLVARSAGRVVPLLLDVTDSGSIQAAAEQVAALVGDAGLAGLVNNAGIVIPGPLEYLPIAKLRTVLEVNLVGHVAVTQVMLPLLRQGRGRIVFMSSLGGRVASPLTGSYNASKFGLEAIADVWRMELTGCGIPVSVIEPGPVATPIWRKSIKAGDGVEIPEAGQQRYAGLVAGVRAWAERSAEHGIPLDDVVDAVVHALTAAQPRTRYPVGKGSRLFLWTRLLPDRLRDRLVVRALVR